MNLVLARFPEFQASWTEHKSFWGDEEAGIGNDVTAFSRYTKTLIEKDDPSLIAIFDFAEECLIRGDEQIQTAFKTSFLENLMNYSDQVDLTPIVCFLGEESRLYCKAWNNFTGIDVPGI